MRAPALAAIIASSVVASEAFAQHDHGGTTNSSMSTDTSAEAPAHTEHAPGVLGLPMSRHGSGTAWLPDASPMRGAMRRIGGWNLMLHGNFFAGYDYADTDGGTGELVSQNWLMAMAGRRLGGGELELRTMLSLEPLTLGDDGYPLAFQTGETLDGEPLIDRQHPHDLFMELATRYQRELGSGIAFDVYAALAGEPAIGPVAFPHRTSAMPDPLAPLGHHWLDATHISYGVLTAGLFTRVAKLEGSWFNGREPDEERYDLDLRGFDSYAARLSVNPTASWSLQASYAFLDSPETLHPEESVQRVTASAVHAEKLGEHMSWTSTAAVGLNITDDLTTRAVLAETALDADKLGVTFLRAEHDLKAGEDFGLTGPMAESTLAIYALSLGHVHPIADLGGVEAGLGARGSIAYRPAELESRYGTRWPLGAMAFVQVQPSKMDMSH